MSQLWLFLILSKLIQCMLGRNTPSYGLNLTRKTFPLMMWDIYPQNFNTAGLLILKYSCETSFRFFPREFSHCPYCSICDWFQQYWWGLYLNGFQIRGLNLQHYCDFKLVLWETSEFSSCPWVIYLFFSGSQYCPNLDIGTPDDLRLWHISGDPIQTKPAAAADIPCVNKFRDPQI